VLLGWGKRLGLGFCPFFMMKGEGKGVQGDGGREAGAKKGKEFPPKK
jgi:hypothetical protein